MRKFILAIITVFSALSAFSQSPQRNLEKYWHYRDRLRERFVVVSQDVEEEGVNIPAGDIFGDTVSWSDGNSIMSHYLSLLSTELWLLKTNHQDYSQTLAELYYAMLALERLDLYSESHWRRFDGLLAFGGSTADSLKSRQVISQIGQKPAIATHAPSRADINGMHLRDDISPAFWNKHQSHFGVSEVISNFYSGLRPLEACGR